VKTRFEMTQECLQALKKGEQLAFTVDGWRGKQVCLVRNVDGHPEHPLFNMRVIEVWGDIQWEALFFALAARSKEMDLIEEMYEST